MPPVLVELQHAGCDDHAPGHLEGHAADDVLQVPGVRVEGRVVQLLRVDDIVSCRTRRFLPFPIQRRRDKTSIRMECALTKQKTSSTSWLCSLKAHGQLSLSLSLCRPENKCVCQRHHHSMKTTTTRTCFHLAPRPKKLIVELHQLKPAIGAIKVLLTHISPAVPSPRAACWTERSRCGNLSRRRNGAVVPRTSPDPTRVSPHAAFSAPQP